jgi:hypothetical protein
VKELHKVLGGMNKRVNNALIAQKYAMNSKALVDGEFETLIEDLGINRDKRQKQLLEM